MKNVEGHRVDIDGVAATGADIGFVATLLASIFPVFLASQLDATKDIWTFWKSISTIVIDNEAVIAVRGFDAAPVVLGLGIQLFLAASVAAIFALTVSYFGVSGMAPTAIGASIILALYAFLLTWVPASMTILPALADVPLVSAGMMYFVFGLVTALGIAGWRTHWDGTDNPSIPRDRNKWLLITHGRGIAATVVTLVLVATGVAILGVGNLRLSVLVPYLAAHIAAAAFMSIHAARDYKLLQSSKASA